MDLNLQITPEMAKWIVPASIFITGIVLSLWVIYLGSLWLIFNKAGRAGWLVFIPIVNILVLLRISGKPLWYFLLLFIPILNIIVLVMIWIDLAKVFGKGSLFALGLLFFNWIFVVILAFGQAEYHELKVKRSQIDEFTPLNIRPV